MCRVLLVAASLACAAGFAPQLAARPAAGRSLFAEPEGSSSGSLVPVSPETVSTSAAVSAGAVGLVVGGPVFAALAAVLGNYASKQENEIGDVIRGVGKVSLDVYNFLVKLNVKYDLTSKASTAAGEAFEKVKAQDKEGQIAKAEAALKEASTKASKVSEEYDLVEKSKRIIGYAGDLSSKAIDKSLELNQEYKITDKVGEAVKTAVDKGKDAAKKQM